MDWLLSDPGDASPELATADADVVFAEPGSVGTPVKQQHGIPTKSPATTATTASPATSSKVVTFSPFPFAQLVHDPKLIGLGRGKTRW